MVIRVFFIVLITVSCTIPGLGDKDIQSINDIRAMQTEFFKDADSKQVMKAAINTLQDDGFMITYTDLEVGIISAERSESASTIMDVVITEYINAALISLPWKKTAKGMKTVYANVNITELKDSVKARTTFLVKLFDKEGKLKKQINITKEEVFFNWNNKILNSFIEISQ